MDDCLSSDVHDVAQPLAGPESYDLPGRDIDGAARLGVPACPGPALHAAESPEPDQAQPPGFPELITDSLYVTVKCPAGCGFRNPGFRRHPVDHVLFRHDASPFSFTMNNYDEKSRTGWRGSPVFTTGTFQLISFGNGLLLALGVRGIVCLGV